MKLEISAKHILTTYWLYIYSCMLVTQIVPRISALLISGLGLLTIYLQKSNARLEHVRA